MRSNRSNSMSSNSSTESVDSAYKSCPGTPRSLLHGSRSPFMEKQPLPSTPEAPTLPERHDKMPCSPLATASSPNSKDESVLKHALSMPPLVAQHTWFHQPEPPKDGQHSPKLDHLLEYSRRAVHAAMARNHGDDRYPPIPETASQPAPPNLQWQPASTSSFLAPAPGGFSHAATPPSHPAAMMYQYSQLAAMQQYAAMQHQLQHARMAASKDGIKSARYALYIIVRDIKCKKSNLTLFFWPRTVGIGIFQLLTIQAI